MQAKFGPLEKKGYKMIDINPDEIVRNNSRVHRF